VVTVQCFHKSSCGACDLANDIRVETYSCHSMNKLNWYLIRNDVFIPERAAIGKLLLQTIVQHHSTQQRHTKILTVLL